MGLTGLGSPVAAPRHTFPPARHIAQPNAYAIEKGRYLAALCSRPTAENPYLPAGTNWSGHFLM